jgi:hypothetical protein
MKKSIGFLAIEMKEDTESNFIVNYINGFASYYPYIDTVLFNSVYKRVDKQINKFATMHISESKLFTGPIMVFNLKNMLFLKNCIGKKIFFSLRPEWLAINKNTNYEEIRQLYEISPDVLCVPTPEYVDLYELCWKKPDMLDPSNYQKVMEYAGLQ